MTTDVPTASAEPAIIPWSDPFTPEQRQFLHALIRSVETLVPDQAGDLPHRFLCELADLVRRYDTIRTQEIDHLRELLTESVSRKLPRPLIMCVECPSRETRGVPR